MQDDNGVFLEEFAASHHCAIAVLELLRDPIVVGVDSRKTLEPLPEARRKCFEGGYRGRYERISTRGLWGLEHADESCSWGLRFGRLVGVPLNGRATLP